MGIRRFSDNFPKILQIKHVSCERRELRQPSAVFASKEQSEQIKHVSCERSELRQPSAVFANQLKQASQALSTLAKRANQASREGRNGGIQKVALKSLKLGYV